MTDEALPLETELEDAPLKVTEESEPTTEGDDAKRVKDAQAKLHEVTQRNAALEKEMAELRGKVDAVIQLRGDPQKKEDEPQPFSYLNADAPEDLLDDPKNVVSFVKKLAEDFSKTLELRDRALLAELRKGGGDKLAELRAKPEYAGLDDSVLERIAENLTRKAPRSPAGGGRSPGAAPVETEVEKLAKEYEKRMGYDQ